MANDQIMIAVRGAAEGPLNHVDLDLPLGRLICFVGRSGAGSRAMAVDVLYAESHRRYMLALSPFERENLGGPGRVEVEHVSGLPPAMFFDCRGIRRKESLAAFLQVEGLLGQLFHQYGEVECLDCGGRCRAFTEEEAAEEAIAILEGERSLVLAPLEWSENMSGQAMVQEVRRAGFLRIRLAGEIVRLDDGNTPPEARLNNESLEVVIDRLAVDPDRKNRVVEAIRNARAMARGRSLLLGTTTGRQVVVNQQLSCGQCGRSYPDLIPDDFVQTGAGRQALALQVDLKGLRIEELEMLELEELLKFLEQLVEAGSLAQVIARPLEAALALRLGHLNLSRTTDELSTGEQQRLLLASCQSSGLVGILYIFEAPSAGLHLQEMGPLVEGLRQLVAQGNTVLVLDHANPLLQAADEILAFENGKVMRTDRSWVETEPVHRKSAVPDERFLRIRGVGPRNLQPFDVQIPLHCLVCVTGVSGAGKSALLHQVIAPALRAAGRQRGGANKQVVVQGGEGIHRLVEMAGGEGGKGRLLLAELGFFDYLAGLYAETPAARKRGYPQEWFLLDGPGGRCAMCEGQGVLRYDLEFLEDISLPCPACEGRHYRPEILEITLRGQSMSEVLEMTIEQAFQHFGREARIVPKLEAAHLCGLGGRRLGESSRQMEWGEFLRLQLAAELVRVSTRELIILDSPARGSHPRDLELLVRVLREMVGKGASVLVGDQHPGLLAAADWIVELGPGGGPEGGQVLASGPPEDCLDLPPNRV